MRPLADAFGTFSLPQQLAIFALAAVEWRGASLSLGSRRIAPAAGAIAPGWHTTTYPQGRATGTRTIA